MANPLIAHIHARLKEIDEERDHLVALAALYEKSPITRNGTNGANVVQGIAIGAMMTPRRLPAVPFQAIKGGPTERILGVLSQEEGLTYSEVIERAVKGMQTDASDPERSLGSTLQSLVKRGKVERNDKKHYLPKRLNLG